jgi:hypothetical protein
MRPGGATGSTMAEAGRGIELPKPWEVLAVIFGYFTVAKDVPNTLRTLGISKIARFIGLRDCLLRANRNPDFWLLLPFTIVACFLFFWLLLRSERPEEPPNNDRLARASAVIRRGRIIRVIRSLGLVVLRERILDRMGVAFYETFRRPTDRNWPPEPGRAEYIDRILFKDGQGTEFQYSNDHRVIFVRRHPPNVDAWGPTEEQLPKADEVKLLLFASNYFPFWLLAYLVRRLLPWSRRPNV